MQRPSSAHAQSIQLLPAPPSRLRCALNTCCPGRRTLILLAKGCVAVGTAATAGATIALLTVMDLDLPPKATAGIYAAAGCTLLGSLVCCYSALNNYSDNTVKTGYGSIAHITDQSADQESISDDELLESAEHIGLQVSSDSSDDEDTARNH